MTLPPDNKPSPRSLLFSDWRLFLAFGGGAGLSPVAPGTAGTVLAFPLYYAAAALLPPSVVVTLAAGMLLLGIPLCAHAGKALSRHDDRAIVWDEIAAFFAVLALIPPDWRWQGAAFIIFRLLDGIKPFPLNYIDRKVTGGLGVMLDDIAAAAITVGVVFVGRSVGV